MHSKLLNEVRKLAEATHLSRESWDRRAEEIIDSADDAFKNSEITLKEYNNIVVELQKGAI